MFAHLRRDFVRCGDTTRERVREFLFNPGMWAVIGYRYRRWVVASRLPKLVRLPFALVGLLVQVLTEVVTGVQLSSAATIGPGLYIPHTGTIVVGSGSVIGRNCTLCHCVTVGHRGGGRTPRFGSPVIGDRVYIGPGSAVVGPLTVGEDAVIGVAAVVVKPVPPRAVVAGNPARVLSDHGSFDLIRYPGCEADPPRVESLARRFGATTSVSATAPAASVPSAAPCRNGDRP